MIKVLFVCTGNFYRSRFSEAIFNHQAQLRDIHAVAFSRGFYPHKVSTRSLADGNELSIFTRQALAERNISLSLTGSRRIALTNEDLLEADRVIAMSEKEHKPMAIKLFPDQISRIEFWDFADLPFSPELTLPKIEEAVIELVNTLT